MSQETKKVLEMLAAGQITAEDAEKLLEKLGANGPAGAQASGDAAEQERKSARVWGWKIPPSPESSGRAQAAAGEAPAAPNQKLRFLRVVVDTPGRDQVNIRVPLQFLRAGIKLLGVIPPQASAKLAEKGIDLNALRDLKGGELVDELKDLHVDVDSQNGEKVRVFCE